ncbi:MAG: hypothetical protein AAB839_01695, partial [Patescibacteria group bacterium]
HLLKPSTWAWIRSRRAAVASFRKVRDADLMPLLCGVITNQDIENPILSNIINPMLNGYFGLLKRIL